MIAESVALTLAFTVLPFAFPIAFSLVVETFLMFVSDIGSWGHPLVSMDATRPGIRRVGPGRHLCHGCLMTTVSMRIRMAARYLVKVVAPGSFTLSLRKRRTIVHDVLHRG